MIPYFPFVEASVMGGGGGGGEETSLFDHVSSLPTVFSFDLANGWSCEVCADEGELNDRSQFIGTNYTKWDDEFQSTFVLSKDIKLHYLRIYKNSALVFITDVFSYDQYAEWYASNGSVIGDLKKTIKLEYSDFSVKSVQTGYSEKALIMPYIILGCTYTNTANGVVTTSESTRTALSSSTKYICKGGFNINLYAEFVNAVRKFSDEFNGKNAT